MKLFIMTDLEGATGVTGKWDIFNYPGREFISAKKHLTGDINAAIDGAIETKKVDDITVLDGHGYKFSIDLDSLNPRAHLLQGERYEEVQGFLDKPYDMMFAIGVHAMAGTPKASLSHTLSASEIINIWLNGILVGELGIWAAWAGEVGVPVGLVVGDEAATEEAKKLLGNIETVAVKKGISRFYSELVHPTVTALWIKEAAKKAINRISGFKPWKPGPPFEMKIEYSCPHNAERKASRPGVKLIDSRTVMYTGNTMRETSAIFS